MDNTSALPARVPGRGRGEDSMIGLCIPPWVLQGGLQENIWTGSLRLMKREQKRREASRGVHPAGE